MKFNVTDYGAVSSTTKVQTKEIQNCIDDCKRNGGGEVVIPKGTFIIGSIRLYSEMTLYLEDGAVLLGSSNLKDYTTFHKPTTIRYLYDEATVKNWHLPPYYFYSLITAFNEKNIRIIGQGSALIDGNHVFDPDGEEKFRGPMGIVFSNVENVEVSGYTMKNSSNWSHVMDGCENIHARNVKIFGGHDGFDFHHSSQIEVSHCQIETGDDCFAGYDIQNLYVHDCLLNTSCNAARVGGRNIRFENCRMEGPGRYPHLLDQATQTQVAFMYFAMNSDPVPYPGEKISFKNCEIMNVEKFVLYEHQNHWVLQEGVELEDFTIENTTLSNLLKTSSFRGNGKQTTLTMKNISVDFNQPIPFLEIDHDVKLILENVEFIQPIVIKTPIKELSFHGRKTVTIMNGDILKSNFS